MLENFLGFTLENVANVSRRKLGVVGGGGGTRNFRANDAKYFLCSQGVAVCRPMPHECAITRLLGASIFSFLGMEFIRSWAKKKKVRSRRGHRHMFYIQFPDNLLLI